jgi:hypothetical protein
MRINMNLQSKKLELVQLILNTEKPAILARVEAVLKEKAVDWWDKLSSREKEAIEKGLSEARSGELIPHEEVMKEARAKYNLD